MPKFGAGTVKILRAGGQEQFTEVYDAKRDEHWVVGEPDKEFEIDCTFNPIEPHLSLQVCRFFVFCRPLVFPPL